MSLRALGRLLESTPQILFSNLTAAVAMMNSWYWLQTTGELDYSELVFNTRAGRMTPLPLPGAGGGPLPSARTT